MDFRRDSPSPSLACCSKASRFVALKQHAKEEKAARSEAVSRLAELLKQLRHDRRISIRQLADEAAVNPSVANRAESGKDAKLTTWVKLFEALGYRLDWNATELCEESAELLAEEADRRREREKEGLCFGKRRFY